MTYSTPVRARSFIAVAITGQPQNVGFPLTIEVKSGNMPEKSWVKISQIRKLSVERIGKVIGQASPDELIQVIDGLNEIVACRIHAPDGETPQVIFRSGSDQIGSHA